MRTKGTTDILARIGQLLAEQKQIVDAARRSMPSRIGGDAIDGERADGDQPDQSDDRENTAES
jgi:hypothetical protein